MNVDAMAIDHSIDVQPVTIYGAIEPLFAGTGSVRPAQIEPLNERLGLLVGNLQLSQFEDDLSTEWPRCRDGRERAFRVTTAFWQIIHEAAERHQADAVLLDVGPNLGAINRSALVASSHVVIPVAPDLFSLQGLKNMGPTLKTWRTTWGEALKKAPAQLGQLPQGDMQPVGYVLMQHAERLGQPTQAYGKWRTRLPDVYQESILGDRQDMRDSCIYSIKHYRSLMPMAMEKRKPMFMLNHADGAIGAHQLNVQQCYADFSALVDAIRLLTMTSN